LVGARRVHDSWVHWHEHVNASATDGAILISYTDEPLLKALGIHREENAGADQI
jgi:gentisate 1,2-dioxygenase